MKNLGIKSKVLSLEPNTLNDVWENIKTIATNLNKLKLADQMIARFHEKILDIRKNNPSKIKNIACIEWIEPLMFSGNWVPEIVEICGGRDLF